MSSASASDHDRVARHRAFWDRAEQEYPPASFRVVPDFFFSRHYEAARPLLVPKRRITPDLLDVDAFMPDYERMYETSVTLGQDGFWVAEPFTGIPWMEAILGCEVLAGSESFISHPWMKSLDEVDAIAFDANNPWLKKYLEFTQKLVERSQGRFPVGMPIMRGPADMVGAIMGQTEMVMALYDEPERMKEFFLRVTDVFLRVIAAQNALIPGFRGGSALGFYHVYCPGKSIWYQEDLSAIMSPELYREFLSEPERRICAGHDYTAIHLHPASFFLLDELIAKEDLKAIEVNKDIGGPSVAEMLPHLAKILEKKCLILWGDLNADDIALLQKNFSPRGLFLNVIAPDEKTAAELLAQIRAWPAR
jgi:hypothetical protein